MNRSAQCAPPNERLGCQKDTQRVRPLPARETILARYQQLARRTEPLFGGLAAPAAMIVATNPGTHFSVKGAAPPSTACGILNVDTEL
jgi:hypothetical protein